MKKTHKAIHSEEQKQCLNPPKNEGDSSHQSIQNRYNFYEKKKRTQYEKNWFVVISFILILAFGGVIIYRYIQLMGKNEDVSSINLVISEVNIENDHKNSQTLIEHQIHPNSHQDFKMQIKDDKSSLFIQQSQNKNKMTTKIESEQAIKNYQNKHNWKNIIINQKQNIQANNNQNFQQQNIIAPGQIEKQFENQPLQQTNQNNQQNPKFSQNLQKNQKQQLKHQSNQHQQQKEQVHENQQRNQQNKIIEKKSQNKNIQSKYQKANQINQHNQYQNYKTKQAKIENTLQKIDINKQTQPSKKISQNSNAKSIMNENRKINQKLNEQIKKISYIENQRDSKKQEVKYQDPILNVKDQIAKNFKMKFQDTIYIKKGTKITPQQFYRAKSIMTLWKYFNVQTNNIQFLDEPFLIQDKNNNKVLQKMTKLVNQQRQQFQRKYHISKYEQIPFCIIVPSYKNSDKYFRNINSIFLQQYENFHVVYIDDASKDGTADLVRSYIKKYNIPDSKMKFIQNERNKKALPNIDFAARNICNEGEIMMIIDGDDYLIGRQVLKVINAEYQRKKLLALYTNHIRVHQPIYQKVGTCVQYPPTIKKARAFRHFSIFPASHLRTFYVDLYRRIKVRDLKDTRGQYFYAANDFAIMMPILEMAGQRFEYLPELTYVYDAGTGYNNFQTKNQVQAKNFNTTKRRSKYPKLASDTEFAQILLKKSALLPSKASSAK